MITQRGQHIHFLQRIWGVTTPKLVVMSLVGSTLILTSNNISTFGGDTVTKCRLQVHLLESSLVPTSHWVLVTS